MFPRISDLINYLTGTHISLPFHTYGTMLALAFLAGGLIVNMELKRKEKEGLLPARTRSNRQADRPAEEVHPHQFTWSIMIVGLVSAIAGSKLFDILDNFGSFLIDPLQSLTSFNGFAFLGGLIVTVVMLVLYMRVIRLDWRYVIDCTAPAIMLGYAIGRLGCHLSGDGCWGIPNNLPQPSWLTWLPGGFWACHYPHNVMNAGIAIPGCHGMHCMALAEPVYPTSLYESLMSFAFFFILWTLRKWFRPPVVLFGLFLILHGSARILIEQIRVNNKYQLLWLQVTQAEVISLGLILLGAAVMVWFSRHKAVP